MFFHPFPPTELDRLLAADPLAEAASRAVLAAAGGHTPIVATADSDPAARAISWGKLETTAAVTAALLG